MFIILVGAQMAALYGRGAPAPAMQAPYGQAAAAGDAPQPPLPTAQPTVPSGRRPSPPQAQQRQPSPPQAQQRAPEACLTPLKVVLTKRDIPLRVPAKNLSLFITGPNCTDGQNESVR